MIVRPSRDRPVGATRSRRAEMIGKLTHYERWIVPFAKIVFCKGIVAPTG
jgi:hypothetical protein